MLSSCVWTCTFIPRPLHAFDPSESIFIGKVTGYTDPVRFESRKDDPRRINPPRSWFYGSGVVVDVVESLHLAGMGHQRYEVFNFNIDGGCGSEGIFPLELERRYPVGSEVVVIGDSPTMVPSKSENSVARLEIDPITGVLRTISGAHRPTIESSFDYSTLNRKHLNENYGPMIFEIRKDLLRLSKPSTEAQKIEVLTRLINVPRWLYQIDLLTLIRTHVREKRTADELYLRALKNTDLKQEKIDFHLKCVQDQIKRKTYEPGRLRC